jgi:hypothetical protein
MDESTATTSGALQKLIVAQDTSVKILQQEQAERGKKPRLALYVGNAPLDKAAIRTKLRNGSTQTFASLDLSLRNEGDAPVSTFRIHAIVPRDVFFDSNSLFTVPDYEPLANPALRVVTLQLPPLPAGQTIRLHVEIGLPSGHAPFKIPFTVDAIELQAVGRLGSLALIPPKP